ncbi:MAG: hypothetical protein K5871_11085 [Lachnospiraceae bacterium]|nr:hypothetical protein [Lachnospiraceae bacterium]
MEVASLVLGIVGLFGWILPLIGYPVNIVGLILGIKTVKGEKRKMSIAGIVCCSIGLVLTLISSILGVLIMNYIQTM